MLRHASQRGAPCTHVLRLSYSHLAGRGPMGPTPLSGPAMTPAELQGLGGSDTARSD